MGVAWGIPNATIPTCRAGIGTQVSPGSDTLVCDANGDIASSYLLMAVAAQNYGQNTLRVRQPFDFAGRTGKIVFDAQGYVFNPLYGWISLSVIEDPAGVPSYSLGDTGTTNEEGGAAPRSGFEVQFGTGCGGFPSVGFGLTMLDVFNDYKDTVSSVDQPACISGQEGKLNHFEITVSQTQIEVSVSPVSADGKTFEPVAKVKTFDVDLPFTRGYVELSTYNHATLKYSQNGDYGSTHVYDAWLTRWDNVGFDGPVIGNTREYEIADSLIPGMNSWNFEGPVTSVGYRVPDAKDGPNTKLTFKSVDLAKATSARLSLVSWYLNNDGNNPPSDKFILRYRLNGKAWHDRPLTPGEIALLTNSHSQGQLAQTIDVPVPDLVSGDNTLEFVATGISQGYPPAVSSIDLILGLAP